MKKIKILDCTLRDGGYYTNWDFNDDLIDTYFKSLNSLPIEYIEIGYKSPNMNKYYGEFFYCSNLVLDKIKSISNKKLAIILNEKDIDIENITNLLSSCIGKISLVRIALDPTNLENGLILAMKLKSMDFDVALNIMYMSKWKSLPNFFKQLNNLEKNVDFLYMVDSYGGLFPEELVEIIKLIKEQTNVELGFHGHNNIELALINSLVAIDNGVTIIDSTITGMGRGAGNLKTELILTVLNSKYNHPLNYDSLSDIVSIFTNLQKKHEWGTNLPYMISGVNSLPQKEVMNWVGKRYFSLNTIVRALNNQKTGSIDNEKYPIFTNNNNVDFVIIIGGGESANKYFQSIELYINTFENNIAIIHASSKNSLNYQKIKHQQFFCLVGNEGNRLENIFKNFDNFSSTCVLPPYPRKMGTYVPASIKKNTFEFEKMSIYTDETDSHTALAIETAIAIGAKTCFFVGYDGYNGENITEKERDLLSENENVFNQALNFNLSLISLTNTVYKNLKNDSIFSKI